MSGPRTLFRGIGFFVFFWFSSSFFDFSLRKLLSATRTTKNQKTSRKTKKTKKNKKNKKTKGFSGMSGPRTLFRGIVFFVFFGFPRIFLVFGSGSFYRLLGPPKPRGKQKKQKKTQCSQECLGPFLQMQWCFMCFLFFLFFGCGSRPPQKINLFSFKPYHPLICLQLVFCFVQCFV